MQDTRKIALQFIKQYYQTLSKNPEDLHKFYTQESCFTYGVGTEENVETYEGVEAIKNRISTINFVGSLVDFSQGTVDYQKSEKPDEQAKGVFIVVTGNITLSSTTTDGGAPPTITPFVQSFILSNPQGDGRSYYVRNSIFRLLTTSLNGAKTEAAKASVSVSTNTTKKTPSDDATTKEKENVKATPIPEAVSAVTAKSVEPTTTTTPTTSSVSSSVPESVEEKEAPSGSWADITRKLRNTAISEPVPQAKPKAKAPVETGDSEKERVDIKDKSKYAVYVNQLPPNVTKDELLTVFSRFGKITGVDVQTGRGFAFVEYENADGMNNALTPAHASTLVIGTTTLNVEQKKGGGNSGKDKDKGSSGDKGKGSRGGRGGGGDKDNKGKGDGKDKDSRRGNGNGNRGDRKSNSNDDKDNNNNKDKDKKKEKSKPKDDQKERGQTDKSK